MVGTPWLYYLSNSNTSHVLIYLIHILYLLQCLLHSNTSHVLIYQENGIKNNRIEIIQIHLMFLFIRKDFACYLYGFCIQIHLMFLFIRQGVENLWTLLEIQIHLMFLFIVIWFRVALLLHDSNTSHVLIYRIRFFRYIGIMANSNTSHVLIYLVLDFANGADMLFKYISCSYLSRKWRQLKRRVVIQIHLMFLFIIKPPLL